MNPIPEYFPVLVGTIAIDDVKDGIHATEFGLDKDTSKGLISMEYHHYRVPSSEKSPQETRGTSGTKFPVWKELRESMHSWVSTTHSLLEKDHIRANRKKERAEAALFGLAPQTSDIERKDQY